MLIPGEEDGQNNRITEVVKGFGEKGSGSGKLKHSDILGAASTHIINQHFVYILPAACSEVKAWIAFHLTYMHSTDCKAL